jgi:hypothetical protein
VRACVKGPPLNVIRQALPYVLPLQFSTTISGNFLLIILFWRVDIISLPYLDYREMKATYRTPLPRIPQLLIDVLSGSLLNDGQGIFDVGELYGFHRNAFTGRCPAVDYFSCPTIPAISHITLC